MSADGRQDPPVDDLVAPHIAAIVPYVPGDGTCDAASGEDCGNCSGDCGYCYEGCVASGGAGCDGCACEADVCAADAYCCATEWDALCASRCREEGSCGGPPACGDGDCERTEGCVACEADCGGCGGFAGDPCDEADSPACLGGASCFSPAGTAQGVCAATGCTVGDPLSCGAGETCLLVDTGTGFDNYCVPACAGCPEGLACDDAGTCTLAACDASTDCAVGATCNLSTGRCAGR